VTRSRLAALLVAVVALGAAGLAVGLTDRDSAPQAATTTTTSATVTTEPASTIGAEGVGDPYFPTLGNGGYDVRHYDLALTWVADTGTLQGVATIDAVATQDLTQFDLDLSGLEVRSVLVAGRAAGVTRHARELVIRPARKLVDGKAFTTTVTYDGVPHTLSEGTNLFDEGWQTYGREAFVVSEPSGAETFFPSDDHPSDKATYTFHVTAPSDQTVAANGLLQDKVASAGTTTWTYRARDPIASYLVQIAIGDLELVDGGTVDGVVLRHALHRSLATVARTTVARTGEMLQFLEGVWGPFPFEAYGVLAVDQPLGFALETQSLTLIGSDMAEDPGGSQIALLHELAHQWVGDSVSPATWKDIWLNEGFATYSEWLWSEHAGGPSPAQIARSLGPGLDLPPGDPGRDDLFSRTVYARGAATLQAVREAVGDALFFTILKAWPAQHRGSAASTADFEALAEKVSGQDLRPLFQRWLYDPVAPSQAGRPASNSVMSASFRSVMPMSSRPSRNRSRTESSRGN
jgi:aminopeptidase N